ncbi:MAG: GAF domain-containing protein [Syntrophobacterales bacterium]|nr:GAF domain-containing protein [Syntrophobacterales bacterium]
MEKIHSLSLENKNLRYRLTLIFSFFFFAPFFGLLYFGLKYNMIQDEFLPFFVVMLLISLLIGYVLIRRVFDRISGIYRQASDLTKGIDTLDHPSAKDELSGILDSFQVVNNELKNSFGAMQKRTAQLSTLKELSDLCYITFDSGDLFSITLEMAMKLTKADIGSILLIEGKERDTLVVRATYGMQDHIGIGDRIDFSTSIAKYAIINKSPLLVDDIEKDDRFGRENRPQYATKSFLCMPLKGMQEVFGALTLSRRAENIPFSADDVEVLTPLISNAAITHDNLHLREDYKKSLQQLEAYADALAILGSSLRNGELLHAILNRVQKDIPFDIAAILEIPEENSEQTAILDVISTIPTGLFADSRCNFIGSSLEVPLKQGNILSINNAMELKHPLDQNIFSINSVKEAVLAPLKIGGRVIGIAVFGSLGPGAIGKYEKQIGDVASLLSIAVEKSHIYRSLYKRHQEMDSIQQIGGILAASTFDQQQVLNHTMEMIRTTINVEAGNLMLLEDNALVSKIAFNVDPSIDLNIFQSIHTPFGLGIAGYSAARGESIIVPDAQKSRHFSPEIDLKIGFHTRSVLCVPLISRGRVLGVIETINKIDGAFNDADLHLLQSIATSVSIALENSRLYQETLSMAEHEREIRKVFQRFVPHEIVDQIIYNAAEGKPLPEELKTITLLNIDIRNFSNLSRKMGPQRTVAILNRFFAEMGEIIFSHSGIVDKYLGDGFLALFGAPVSSLTDAENAVRAALEMKERFLSINSFLVSETGFPLSMGISIHTGEAVVGNIGFDKKMDYTVIGDSVNAVFRLQYLTKTMPNGILISEKTLRAVVSPALDVQEMGRCDLGSTLGELAIYELLGFK